MSGARLAFALLLVACDGPRAGGADDAGVASADLSTATASADLARGNFSSTDLANANFDLANARVDLASSADLAHVSLGAGPFAGSYLCQTTSTTTFTSPPSTTNANGIDYVNVVDGTATDLVLQLQGGFLGACDLGADRSGSSATIVAGQTCSTTASGVTVVFTVASGSATASPGTLLFDASGPISGAMGTSSVTGSFTTSYQCAAQ